jgi:hypothetical protein
MISRGAAAAVTAAATTFLSFKIILPVLPTTTPLIRLGGNFNLLHFFQPMKSQYVFCFDQSKDIKPVNID